MSAITIPRFFNRDLPEKLHGVWETTETKYENRYLLKRRIISILSNSRVRSPAAIYSDDQNSGFA
ncbi:hypothetical protein D1BOALGB6SA_8187 [Olavius sp. associated proteobacterium Delta 1]|nr:hypothetical protein D1BOALGB6SA_8187 [Olavius sp. associated proteobacterium Delta 1]